MLTVWALMWLYVALGVGPPTLMWWWWIGRERNGGGQG